MTSRQGTTTSLFRVAFNLTEAQMTDRGLPADLTLLQAVELSGGDFWRSGSPGDLSPADSLSMAYGFSTDQVLQDVYDAFISGDIGTLIDDYNTANNRDHGFCPTGDTLPPSSSLDAFGAFAWSDSAGL